MPTAILLAGAGPPLRASLCARLRQRVDRYLLRLNAAQGGGLRSFGLPFAFAPTPWYALPVRGHRLNRPVHSARRANGGLLSFFNPSRSGRIAVRAAHRIRAAPGA